MVSTVKNRAFGKLRKKRVGYRIMGWWFLIQGVFMSIIFGNLMLDPEGVITYNGVETTSFEVKRNAFLFTTIFPIIGVGFVLIPKRKLNKLLFWQTRVNPFSRG
jgi:hypothetical protein